MPYHMMVTLSETEKNRVLSDMIDEMSMAAMEKLMLRLARDLNHMQDDHESQQLLRRLTTALTPKRPRGYHLSVAKCKPQVSKLSQGRGTAPEEEL